MTVPAKDDKVTKDDPVSKDDQLTSVVSPGAPRPSDSVIPAPAVEHKLGVAYAAAGDVRRMLNERANAVAYGNIDIVKGIDRDLKEAGFKGDPAVFADASAPVGRNSGKSDVMAPAVTGPTSSATLLPSNPTPTTKA